MKIKYFLPVIFLSFIIFNSCKQKTSNEYNRFQDDDENYNKIRLFYIEKNYKKAEAYIKKITKKDDFILYLKAKIYYNLKKYPESLNILNSIESNSLIKEYVETLKIDNYSKLKKYNKIINIAKNIHFKNYFLKYKSYKLFGDAFYFSHNNKKSIFFYKQFFSAYNKFYTWRTKKFIGGNFDESFIKFLKLLISKNDINYLISIVVSNLPNLHKKNRTLVLNIISKTVLTNIETISKKNLLIIGKKWYYVGKYKIAKKIFNYLIINNPDTLVAYYFIALINIKNSSKFTKIINNIIVRFNNSDKALYYAGKAYRIKGDFDMSKKFFETLISKKHKSKYTYMAYLNLLSLYYNSTEYETLLFNAINLFPDNREISKLFYLSAIKNLNNGKYKKSLKFFDKLENNKFYSDIASFFKGKIYLKLINKYKAYIYFNKYLKQSNLNFYTFQAGKYIKKVYEKGFKIDNKFTEYFIYGNVRKEIDKRIITGKYYKFIKDNLNFKIMGKFFNTALTFEGKLQLYLLKNKFKKQKTKLYFSLLKYFNDNNIVNESLNMRLILLKKLKYYNNLLFFDKDILIYFFPTYYSKQLNKLIKKYNLDKNYIYGLVYTESLFNQEATSIDNAIGLFQLMPSTARLVAKKVSYHNESFYHSFYNAHLGLRYLADLLKQFKNNYIFALGAYNAGGSRMKKWISKYKYNPDCIECFLEQIPFTETRNYLKKILFLKNFYNINY